MTFTALFRIRFLIMETVNLRTERHNTAALCVSVNKPIMNKNTSVFGFLNLRHVNSRIRHIILPVCIKMIGVLKGNIYKFF